MRIAIVYSPYSMGTRGGFDFPRFYDDPRGQTGSEYGVVRVSQELAKMGHEVFLYTHGTLPPTWEGIHPRHFDTRGDEEHDWAICWNEAGSLRTVKAKTKACSLQINTVVGLDHGLEDHTGAADYWFCPSESHRKRLIGQSPGKWVVAYDGVDPELYVPRVAKIPGRVAWTSSPDRGLHWLLRAWPKIRREVPWATLKIFYPIASWIAHFQNKMLFDHPEPSIREQARRVAYIEHSMKVLAGQGVESVGGVSRRQIVEEVGRTECVAYTCDTVLWSEGFSCSLMEACAAWACPITTSVDAFPEIYGGILPMVDRPLGKNIDEYAGLVVRALTDPVWREEINERAREHSLKYTWTRMAETKARWLSGEGREDDGDAGAKTAA